MDNERPIEKLLRDYAKKRRADAGEPQQMHPATRRMLLGEVSRQFPKAKRGGSSFFESLVRWRPGLVYGVCALVVTAISVSLLLPTFRTASPESQLAKVATEEESAAKRLQPMAPTISAAPALPEADEASPPREGERSNEAAQSKLALADANQTKDEASGLRRDLGKEKSEATRPLASDALVRSEPASPPAAPQITSLEQSPKRAVEAQGRLGSSAQDSRRMVVEPTPTRAGEIPLAARSPSVTPAPAAPPTAATPETAAFSQRYGIPASASAAVTQKAPTADAVRFRRSASAGADASPVLTTFQFEPAGDQLRVIDSDGSTYSGTISSPATDLHYETKVELTGRPATKMGNAASAKALTMQANDNYQPGQNYFFRVTGTNRTLKQPVVFAGNLLISTNALPAGQAVVTQTSAARSQNQRAPAQSQLPGLLNSSISGSVQLGSSKETKLNAVPIRP